MSRSGGRDVRAMVVAVVPCAIVESPRRHKRVPFVNIAFLRSRSIKRRQWKHKLDYYGVVFAHLATECGIKAKDPSGLDWDRWIPHSRSCENPARAKALTGFSRHLSAGFTISLYNYKVMTWKKWRDGFDVIIGPPTEAADSNTRGATLLTSGDVLLPNIVMFWV